MISISGPAGSGKTTLARLLSQRLDLPLISTGQIFRKMAAERGMDVLQFNLLAEGEESIDRELDARVVEEARSLGQCIVESRLACLMLRKAGLTPFCVYVDAPEEIRAARIAGRDGVDKSSSLTMMRERAGSESRRYSSIYGMDPGDRSAYDLLLDSAERPPEELPSMLLDEMGKRGLA